MVKPLPFGGHAYVYEVNGARATVLEPPASFNPRTASARELSVYGFVRPSSKDGKQLAAWNREIASFRSMAGPGLTLACSSGAGIDRPVATGSPRNATEADGYSVKNSQNYSGYSLGSGNGSTFIQVQGDYTQPSATNDCGCYGTPQESTWVGIGGAGFSDLPLQQRALIQIGTAMNESLSGSPSVIQPFYEWLNYGSAGQTTVISGFTKGVHAGDHMQASVEYSSFYQQADFLLVDGRTGEWGPNTNISVPKSYYDGATVEWINEDPGGGSVPLSNYDESPCGCIPWSEVSATDSNGATVTLGGAYPTYLINMYNTAYDPNPADTGPTLFYEKPFGPEDASSLMSSTDGYSYDTDGSASFNTNWWQGEDDLQEYCETGNPNWSGCRGVLN